MDIDPRFGALTQEQNEINDFFSLFTTKHKSSFWDVDQTMRRYE